MDKNPLVKLQELVRKLKIVKHLKRQIFVLLLVKSMIKSRDVIFSELSDKMDGAATNASKERRIQDFFQKVDFDFEQLLILLLCFVPHKKMVLSIDRTEWDHGRTQYNILCIIASVGKMGVPLYFEMLDNKSGNSNWKDRISILKKVIKIVGKERISCLVMDREFIGQKWLIWLKKEKIDFCVRVPKTHSILSHEGEKYKVRDIKRHYFTDAIVDGVAVNVSTERLKDGDYLYLIGTLPINQLKPMYKKRWTIEVFFQAIKGRGFNIEKTGLRSHEKLRKLLAIISIAYTICWATAIEDGKTNPVKKKKHGYPQYSVFRRGLNILRQAMKTGICIQLQRLWKLVEQRLSLFKAKTIG